MIKRVIKMEKIIKYMPNWLFSFLIFMGMLGFQTLHLLREFILGLRRITIQGFLIFLGSLAVFSSLILFTEYGWKIALISILVSLLLFSLAFIRLIVTVLSIIVILLKPNVSKT